MCTWEDDGQDDPRADEVWGGPNGDRSLTYARQQFKQYLAQGPGEEVMRSYYTRRQEQAKRVAMETFDRIAQENDPNTLQELWKQVYDNEAIQRSPFEKRKGEPPMTAEEFFSNYSPEIEAIALRARSLVLSLLPGATEHVDTGNKVVSYSTGGRMKGMVFYISAHKAHANIGLFGADLPDPNGLIEGTGKRLRHVKLRSVADVDRSALHTLLESALAAHHDGITQLQQIRNPKSQFPNPNDPR
ncbi:MAG: DUF1801 domain-containing protein [Chloroflexota bacterium]|nr:DUF1801 domain-containing protein [Chloroflexota bacterium]